jgi:hypothetical protein
MRVIEHPGHTYGGFVPYFSERGLTFLMVMSRLCFQTNFDDMKECDALESIKTIVGCEFARNIPNTTSWDGWPSSAVTWLTLP